MTEEEPAERRRDVNTRKVIEVLTAKMDERVKSVVTWEKLLFILGASGLAIVSAAWGVTTLASAKAEAAASSAKADVAQLRRDSGDAIQLVREELKETRADIRGLYRSVRSNTPSARLSMPVPELPPSPINKEP
jgi:hypothetical protein